MKTTTQRSCGYRIENSLYATVPHSPFGKELAFFLLDPPRLWEGGQLRAPMLVPSEVEEGVNHILLGVGKESYPALSDFLEEGFVAGISKRLPRNFEIERLTPNKSKLLLMHPRAIPDFKYTLDFDRKQWCPNVRYKREPKHIGKNEFCIEDLWSLGYFIEVKEKHEFVDEEEETVLAYVKTPSAHYPIRKPVIPANMKIEQLRKLHDRYFKYDAGVFAMLPIQFEWVNRENKVPKDLADRFKKARWDLEVKPE